MLLAFLRANNGPASTFMVANGLAKEFGWARKRLAAARRRLEGTYIKKVRDRVRFTGAGPSIDGSPRGGQN